MFAARRNNGHPNASGSPGAIPVGPLVPLIPSTASGYPVPRHQERLASCEPSNRRGRATVLSPTARSGDVVRLSEQQASVPPAHRRYLVARSQSPDDIVIDAYFGKRTAPRTLDAAYRGLNVEDSESCFMRLQAAVAAILLHRVRHQLPHSANEV